MQIDIIGVPIDLGADRRGAHASGAIDGKPVGQKLAKLTVTVS